MAQYSLGRVIYKKIHPAVTFLGGILDIFPNRWITHHRAFRSNLWWILLGQFPETDFWYKSCTHPIFKGQICLFSGTKTAALQQTGYIFLGTPNGYRATFPHSKKNGVFWGANKMVNHWARDLCQLYHLEAFESFGGCPVFLGFKSG